VILAVLAAVLAACFWRPLYDLFGFSLDSDFFSYIPLMPAITGYLIWTRRDRLEAGARPDWSGAAAAAAAGGAMLAAYGWAGSRGWHATQQDYLAVTTSSFLLLLVGAGFVSLGRSTMASIAFPVWMLIFVIPCPERLLDVITNFFQQTSTAAAFGMLRLAATPVHRSGILLTLPQVQFFSDGRPFGGLEVDPECSGIHSTMVLLITSLIAGNLFLRSPWRRTALALFVIPLAIARNGFRIFVLAELCIHIKPEMIDTPIHHQGGPIFFLLSLIPFYFVLAWMRKSESNVEKAVKPLHLEQK
jgi:exosortase C (VPDSG-CTERM-specific)